MIYLADADHYRVFTSKAGAPENPDLHHDLIADPDCRIEVGDNTFDVHAEVRRPVECDEEYAEQAGRFAGVADYEKKTHRVMPVVALTR